MARRFLPEIPVERDQYPLHPRWGGIWSGNVLFFRESEFKGYELMDEPFRAGVISVAAINHPQLDRAGKMRPEDEDLTRDKMRTILRIGMEHCHEALVLGAMGCGAFANPPAEIARLFHEVLREKEFEGQFKEIVFAILDDYNALRGASAGNYLPFKREFQVESANH